MSVKGPRVYPMVVSADRPGRRRLVYGALLTLMVLVTAAGWFGGRYAVLTDLAGGEGGLAAAGRLDGIVAENRSMREELAVLRSGGDVAHEVEERVRVDNRDLQDRVAELEAAVAYYRRVAVPDRSGKGLRIEHLAMAVSGTPEVWTLDTLLVRTGDTDGTVEGHFEGRVVAQGPSGTVELPIARLLPAGQQQFRVRYVEEIKADLRLPAGMTPVRVDLIVVLTAPREDRIEKTWLRQAAVKPQEIPANAGQG